MRWAALEPAVRPSGAVRSRAVRDVDVIELCRELTTSDVTFWLVGGWGVDALLGRQTRAHHDLDLLVEVRSLQRFLRRLEALGFTLAHVWSEARWMHDDAWGDAAPLPSAFVHRHPDGREVDTHVLRLADGVVDVLWRSPLPFPVEALGGRGVIAGQPVPCISADMQRLAHTGYELPPAHVEDLEQLSRSSAQPG